jgi:hypothetical protein
MQIGESSIIQFFTSSITETSLLYAVLFIESKRKVWYSFKKRFEKRTDMTVILTSDIDLQKPVTGTVMISHCGKSHDGYMLYFI